MRRYPDDLPGEADHRSEFDLHMEMLRAMELDKTIRPWLTKAVDVRITREEFREHLVVLEVKRSD